MYNFFIGKCIWDDILYNRVVDSVLVVYFQLFFLVTMMFVKNMCGFLLTTKRECPGSMTRMMTISLYIIQVLVEVIWRDKRIQTNLNSMYWKRFGQNNLLCSLVINREQELWHTIYIWAYIVRYCLILSYVILMYTMHINFKWASMRYKSYQRLGSALWNSVAVILIIIIIIYYACCCIGYRFKYNDDLL